MSDRPRVGIVDAGRVGVDWHLPDIRAAGGEVIALADVVPGRAARFAARHGIPHAFDRYPDLLALPELDERTVGMPLSELCGKRLTVGLAAGPGRGPIALAALRASCMKTFVTDEATAEWVLAHD